MKKTTVHNVFWMLLGPCISTSISYYSQMFDDSISVCWADTEYTHIFYGTGKCNSVE